MSLKESYNHELVNKFNYGDKGNLAEAQFITFNAPTSKTLVLCSKLKQFFYQSMPKQDSSVQVDTSEVKEVEIDGDSIMMMIASSKEVDLGEVLLTAKELFKNEEIAQLDGEQKLTVPILDSLDNDELEEMVGRYLANFILASALRKMNQKLSQG